MPLICFHSSRVANSTCPNSVSWHHKVEQNPVFFHSYFCVFQVCQVCFRCIYVCFRCVSGVSLCVSGVPPVWRRWFSPQLWCSTALWGVDHDCCSLHHVTTKITKQQILQSESVQTYWTWLANSCVLCPCSSGRTYRVYLGKHSLKDDEAGSEFFSVARIIYHPKWDSSRVMWVCEHPPLEQNAFSKYKCRFKYKYDG